MALAPEVWTVTVAIVGVVGAAASALLTQRQAHRAAELLELRRSSAALTEARRAERLTHIVAFLEAVQAAERVAVDRHHHGHDGERWHERANATIDRLWVLQKTIHLMCPEAVNQAARQLAFDMADVIWKGPADCTPPVQEKVWAHIRPSRLAFLEVAREELQVLAL